MLGSHLVVDKSTFLDLLDGRVVIGDHLLQEQPGSIDAYEEWAGRIQTWNEYNQEMLARSFSSNEVAVEYDPPTSFAIASATLGARIQRTKSRLRSRVRALRSIEARIDFYVEPLASPGRATKTIRAKGLATAKDGRLFVVHGRRDDTKEKVARFLEQSTRHKVLILHEQPGSGRTIIEKFEDHAAESTFAVVILTGDDEGGLKGDVMSPRARQNVVFELGFFVGFLGRGRVAVIREPGVEEPSDIAGLNYIPLDASGAWKMSLALELRAAGIEAKL